MPGFISDFDFDFKTFRSMKALQQTQHSYFTPRYLISDVRKLVFPAALTVSCGK